MNQIMIIDDDEDFSEALQVSLSMILNRCQFTVCEYSKNVFDLIGKVSPSLVITDMVMPDVEGIEIITHLKQVNPRLPIIAMSGGGRVGGNNYLLLAQELGADAVFEKPLSVDELSKKISELLNLSI